MLSTIRDATMLLAACLLYVALTSGFANACLLVENNWVSAQSAVALCETDERDRVRLASGSPRYRLW